MEAAVALAERAGARASPNPAVGCILVRDGVCVGRGTTGEGGRPHGEAVALAKAGEAARGATAYVTLEPCAHKSPRGPDCAGALVAAGVEAVAVALEDPDPRTAGRGIARLEAAGVRVYREVGAEAAHRLHAPWLVRQRLGRPHWTVKLALSLDGRLADAMGRSQWLTSGLARAMGHRLRASADAVVVGRGTFDADRPRLDVRLPGWSRRQPQPILLSRRAPPVPQGWLVEPSLEALHARALASGWTRLVAEAGPGLATALLAADLADRLVLFRAPLLLGGPAGLGDLGTNLEAAHGSWRRIDARNLGPDTMEIWERWRPS